MSHPAAFPRTVIDRKKEREKSRRKLTVNQKTEVKYRFIRKRGLNHKKDVECVSPSQAGEEIISWNDTIEFVVNMEGEAEIQEMFRKQNCHFSNS